MLAHNVTVAYQLATTAPSKPRSLKRTAVALLRSIKTQRFTWLNKAARIVNRSGRRLISMEENAATQEMYAAMAARLPRAA